MARLDVYADAFGGLFIDVRASRFSTMRRLVLIPLLRLVDAPPPIRGLNPTIDHDGLSYVLMTQYIASVPAREFGAPLANLDEYWDDVTRALDTLFTGF